MRARTASVRRWLLAALLVGAALPAHAAAQQCNNGGTWRAASVNPASVTFSTPTVVDFDNQGIVYGTTVTVNVSSAFLWFIPLPWSLCLNAETPNLGSSQGVTKPLSDLQFELLDGNWRPVTTSQLRIRTGNGNSTVQMRLRIRLSWDADPPGSFGTLLRFTVGA